MTRLTLALMASLLGSASAHGHDAPTGWQFDAWCCSNRDCGQVPADWIEEGAGHVTVKPTGEVMSYDDRRILRSPDGLTYWCRNPNDPNPRTICVYLPPKGM